MMQKTKKWIAGHKILAVLAAGILIFVGYRVFAGTGTKQTGTKYILASVSRGTIVSSVSGTGQVSASDEVKLTSKVSGNLTYVGQAGQAVGAGSLIAQVDASDAQFAYDNEKLSYQKLVTVDPDKLRRAQNAVSAAQSNLDDAYTKAGAELVTALNQFSSVMNQLESMYVNNGFLRPNQNLSRTAENYRITGENAYYDAQNAFDAFRSAFGNVTPDSKQADIQNASTQALATATQISQATKTALDAVVYMRDHESFNKSIADAAYATVSPLAQTANTLVSDISSSKNAIDSSRHALDDANADLDTLRNGPDELALRTEELALQQKQKALADYSIRAPFAGTIATMDVNNGDSVSPGTQIATMITNKKLAEISLNEVDVAKVSVGQKATLAFDAIPDLQLTGTVASIDAIGTVTQGVVNYDVKISLDTDDGRIKPGMSATANIITDSKQDALIVPASAVKTQNGMSYVEKFPAAYPEAQATQGITSQTPPQRQTVETGLSNNTSVEIMSGLNEGDQIVSRTISGTAATQSNAPSLFGGGGGGGGAFRVR